MFDGLATWQLGDSSLHCRGGRNNPVGHLTSGSWLENQPADEVAGRRLSAAGDNQRVGISRFTVLPRVEKETGVRTWVNTHRSNAVQDQSSDGPRPATAHRIEQSHVRCNDLQHLRVINLAKNHSKLVVRYPPGGANLSIPEVALHIVSPVLYSSFPPASSISNLRGLTFLENIKIRHCSQYEGAKQCQKHLIMLPLVAFYSRSMSHHMPHCGWWH